MTIVRKQRRLDGKKQNYYWDDVALIEVDAPIKRSDAGNARVWRLGMPLDNCVVVSPIGPLHPVMHRLRGESMKLRKNVKAKDALEVQAMQQVLYSRLDVVQGLSTIQRQQVLSTIQQLSSAVLSYIPECWEEFRHCAEIALTAVEGKHEYLTELLTIDSILEEQLKQEAIAYVDTDVSKLSKYIEPERLDINLTELPF